MVDSDKGKPNTVASVPNLLRQWDTERNTDFSPDSLTLGSDKSVWWICDKRHEQRARVNVRAKAKNCPVCINKVILAGFNDIATTNPELTKEWNYGRNGDLTPQEIGIGSNKRVWWICDKGHEWEISPNARKGCPFCNSARLLTGVNDLATTHPEIARQWHPTLNGDLKPTDVIAGTHQRIWWICEKGHIWETPIVNRKMGRGCLVCTGQQVAKGINDLATTHPELVKDWHPTKNKISPQDVMGGSEKTAWWICDKGHEWKTMIKNRSRGSGCIYCSGSKVLAGFNDLETLRPDLASEWNPTKNQISPKQIAPAGNKIVWWICKSGHEYQMNLSNRYTGQNCPICSNQRVLIGYNDLATTRPELAAEWHPTKNKKSPQEVTAGSNKKYWWKCEQGHEWAALLANRNLGNGCPRCAWTGFDVSKSAIFYFLEHSDFASRKVGITNQNLKSDRIEGFKSRGWQVVATVTCEDGHKIRDLETKILNWIRKDLGLPSFLGKEEMGRHGGWTETFSSEGISNSEILSKISETKSLLDIK